MKHKILLLTVFLSVLAYTVRAYEHVFISEVLYDSPVKNTTSPYFGQYIELYNPGNETINLADWKLTVEATGKTYTFPDYAFLPQSFLIVTYDPYNINGFVSDDERAMGWTEFHYIYDLLPPEAMEDLILEYGDIDFHEELGLVPVINPIIYQRDLILPFDEAIIFLIDNTGKTRDTVKYGSSLNHGSCNFAPNPTYADIHTFYRNRHLVSSIQRITIMSDLEGSASYQPTHWINGLGEYVRDPRFGPKSALHTDAPISYLVDDNPSFGVNSSALNSIVTVSPLVEMAVIPDADNKMQTDNLNALVEIDYYDGLGQLIQSIQKGATPQGNDLVALMEYDVFAREEKQWLPVPFEGNMGNFIHGDIYKAAANTYEHYSEGNPWSEIIYDNSHFNYAKGNKNPGTAWHEHPSGAEYTVNAANEVKCFFVNNTGKLQCNGYYSTKTLYKTISKDEDNKQTTEYKNKQGQVIMTQQGTGKIQSDFYDTYYVYNDMGQLCYMLPPLAADALGNGLYLDTNDALMKYAYVYKYDERGNQIYKRLPGCEHVEIIYDKACRPVLSCDGNQRANNQWLVNKYDHLGRLIYTGIINRNVTEAEKTMVKKYGDNRVICKHAGGFLWTGYSCNYFPDEIKLLNVYYYDEYSFLEVWPGTITNTLLYQQKAGYGAAWAAYPVFGERTGSKGLPTATATNILGTDDYIYNIDYYDYYGHVVQSRSTNQLGGYDIVYNAYDFTGNLTAMLKEHTTKTFFQTEINFQPTEITEKYTYTYDHAGRLTETRYRLTDHDEVLLAKNEYDELGRLILKTRHNTEDREKYEYNIRNWITRIRSGDFEQKYYYNTKFPHFPDGMVYYNGNISATTWTYNGTVNGYHYSYDSYNRFRSTYTIYNNEFKVDGHMSESFYYDKHGNVTQLTRWDNRESMDVLRMTYNGNQLKKITDSGYSQHLNSIKEYQDLANKEIEFTYDANGNMTMDLDRNIVSIQYNLLNLPELVQFGDGNQIRNTYTADGRKTDMINVLAEKRLLQPLNPGEVIENPTVESGDFVFLGTHYAGNVEYKTENFYKV